MASAHPSSPAPQSTPGTDAWGEQRLLSHVHPPDWRNPTPAPVYDLVVIGGGTAGLVSAVGAAGLGARVALVERFRLGGDCLNTGCVPSKALLRAARAVHEGRAGTTLGVRTSVSVDFAAVMARVCAAREAIAPHDSAARLARLGIDVFFGRASFSGPRHVAVGATTLRFRRAVIATGSRPLRPPVEGLSDGTYLTTDTLFDERVQPRSLLIIGGGPVGCEIAQALALLGTHVVLVESAPRVLPQEDPDASAVVARSLARAGITLVTGAAVERVSYAPSVCSLTASAGTFRADALLTATGRVPSIADLNLAAAGVEADARGVVVDDHLRTTNRRVFAAGDVCSSNRYTHAADAMARIVVQNALFAGRKRVSALLIPRCTYTIPEVAHIGIDAAGAGSGVETITIPLENVDRAVIDDETEGFVRIRHSRGRIRGATIVAAHAGELSGHIASVMQLGGTLADLSRGIFAYPTLPEALRKAGDAYRRGTLSPRVRRLLSRYFALGRR